MAQDPKKKFKLSDDAYFESDGTLFIANPELARAIQFELTTHNGRMIRMARDRFPEEPPYEPPAAGQHRRVMLRSKNTTEASGPVTTGTDDTGPKVNMMCPCAPENP
jgi:hypothetical protein